MILVMVCSRCPLEPVQAAPSLASARWSSPCYLFLLCHLTNVAVVLARQLPDPARAAADQCREGAVALSCRPGASRLATWLPEPARAQSTNWLSTFPHVCAVCPRPCPGCSRWSSNGSSAAHWVCAGGARVGSTPEAARHSEACCPAAQHPEPTNLGLCPSLVPTALQTGSVVLVKRC